MSGGSDGSNANDVLFDLCLRRLACAHSCLIGAWFVSCREEPSNGWHRAEAIRLEQDVFTALAGQAKLYVYKTLSFWSQIKSAG